MTMVKHIDQISDEMITALQEKKSSIDELLSQKNKIDGMMIKIKTFLHDLEEKKDSLDTIITKIKEDYMRLQRELTNSVDKIEEPEEFIYGKDFKDIEKEVMRTLGYTIDDDTHKKYEIHLPPLPIHEDSRNTIVLVDLPNIINSYANYKITNNRAPKNDKLYFDEVLIQQMLKRYALNVYDSTIREIIIYTNDHYRAVNNFIHRWSSISEKPIKLVYNTNPTKYDGDIDNKMMKYLYDNIDEFNDVDVARILLFTGDHIYLEPLKMYMEKGIKTHILGYYGSLSNKYVSFAKKCWYVDGNNFTDNGEQSLSYYYMNAGEFGEDI